MVRTVPGVILLLTLLIQPAHAKDSTPAYIARGLEVEKSFSEYSRRFHSAFTELKSALEKYDQASLSKLTAPPEVMKTGYQVLPKILETDVKSDSNTSVPVSVSYSWKRTQSFIDQESARIAELEEKVRVLPRLGPNERRNILGRIISDYPVLDENHKLIDHHIQHNKFWQKAVHEDRPRFDKLTLLHNSVLEIQELDHRMKTNGVNQVLVAKRKDLESMIRKESIGKLVLPPYLSMTKVRNKWIFTVPVYTDIKDRKFIARFKTAVERFWSFTESVPKKLSLTHQLPEAPGFAVQLVMKDYKPAHAPKDGAAIPDINAHYEKFPKDGAVLTTGANALYAIPNKYVVLGPQDISDRVLAHEFGHIIGFIDGYFRGYKDRQEEGYEILEIVPDNTDIMNNPSSGVVKVEHFERMMELLAAQSKEKEIK